MWFLQILLDSIGVSIWQMVLEPSDGDTNHDAESDSESSLNDVDDGSDEFYAATIEINSQRLAVACDDGCVRMYNVSDKDGLTHNRCFPRVSG